VVAGELDNTVRLDPGLGRVRPGGVRPHSRHR
jgi:hypothetical protein